MAKIGGLTHMSRVTDPTQDDYNLSRLFMYTRKLYCTILKALG